MELTAAADDYVLDVVTPTYNGLPHLRECVSSVARLPLRVHHVVVDGGSDDGSTDYLEAARRDHSHMTVIVRSDRGPADALNTGLDHLRSPRSTVLNADDRFLPTSFARHWEVLRDLSVECVVQCDARVIDVDGEVIGQRRSDRFTRRGWAVRGRRLVHPGAIVPRRYFRDGLRFDAGNHSCWDVQLFLDLAERGACFRVVPATVVDFRLHEGSISGSGRLEETFVRERARMAEPILAELPGWLPADVLRVVERLRGLAERAAAARRL